MTEENNRSVDVFGLSDIEKIQAQIEKDLQNVNTREIPLPAETPAQLYDAQPTESPIFTKHDEWLQVEAVDETAQALDADQSEIGFPQQEKVEGSHEHTPIKNGFYRETIKNKTKRKRIFSKWFKKAISIFLVVSLSMSALGFGIGTGYGYFMSRRNAAAGDGDSSAPTLTSVGYFFKDIVENSAEGTLADIVEFLLPAVVGITSHVPGGEIYGSGLIFAENDERIFIVTSLYVVQDGGNEFEVRIMDSEPLTGRPVSLDNAAYVAILSVDKQQIVAAGIDTVVIATFGDSDQMRVGDTVLAIGNVMGYGNAVTRGVISGSQQTVNLPGDNVLSLMQTDAAINYGNSGGPLINTRGEVIGINLDWASVEIFGRQNVEGIGFSIASNIIAPVLDELVSGRRPALGISGRTILESTARELGILPIGVYVGEVIPGRAAYRGGMQNSDIITGFNGMQIFNWQNLVAAIRASRVGDTVEVNVLRYGTTAITLYIELDVMVVDNF